jgi:hypothetical protein
LKKVGGGIPGAGGVVDEDMAKISRGKKDKTPTATPTKNRVGKMTSSTPPSSKKGSRKLVPPTPGLSHKGDKKRKVESEDEEEDEEVKEEDGD